MKIGRVTGNVWATKKASGLNGQIFLVVSLVDHENRQTPDTLVAIDCVGAGIGDMVLITQGSSARVSCASEAAPIDASIVGIIDSLEIKGLDKPYKPLE